MIPTILFYLFAAVLIGSATMVVSARNPVHSVLFLILAFFNAAALFLIAGAEFLAMTLVIVYVGAVAVLFLFVVMMLDVDFVRLREGFAAYLPLAAIVAGILLAEMVMISIVVAQGGAAADAVAPVVASADSTNVEAIGRVLYTDYVYVFQAAGIVLLIAMIGAIVLTLRRKDSVRRQDPGAQTNRDRRTSVEIKGVTTGVGVTSEELR